MSANGHVESTEKLGRKRTAQDRRQAGTILQFGSNVKAFDQKTCDLKNYAQILSKVLYLTPMHSLWREQILRLVDYSFCEICGNDEDVSYCSDHKKFLCLACDWGMHSSEIKRAFELYS